MDTDDDDDDDDDLAINQVSIGRYVCLSSLVLVCNIQIKFYSDPMATAACVQAEMRVRCFSWQSVL